MTRKLEPWDKLSREKQNFYLEVLWNDGYTESAIAKFLQTTKGIIVRRRATLKLANTPERKKRGVKDSIEPGRFWDLVELDDIRKREARGEKLVFDEFK
ncbi:hypothetical protein C4556_03655 [Candidatus Parcubacteria bacterium]|nr:MAG: hypothetical protein C4556_03655 [Candidatus Parcubacteria bacterium]